MLGAQLFRIPRNGDSADHAFAVLAANGVLAHVLAANRLQGVEHLELFVTDDIGVHGIRRLHGHEAEQLQHVVLNHVPQGAGGVVVACPTGNAQFLGDGDLYVVYPGGVPERLEKRVAEAQRNQVLDRFLAEVVIDPEGLGFAEDIGERRIGLPRAVEVMPDGLFDHDTAQRPIKSELLQAFAGFCKQTGTDGEVEDAHAIRPRVELCLQLRPAGLARDVDRQVIHQRQERAEPVAGDLFRAARHGLGHLHAVAR